MAVVKPRSIQRHPLVWGFVWAGLTVGLIWLIDYASGQRLPNLLITIPIWAIAGASWGYAMKRHYDRKERAQ